MNEAVPLVDTAHPLIAFDRARGGKSCRRGQPRRKQEERANHPNPRERARAAARLTAVDAMAGLFAAVLARGLSGDEQAPEARVELVIVAGDLLACGDVE